MMTKFSPQILETYFRLYGSVTTREKYMYTVGSSIFCMLYLMVMTTLDGGFLVTNYHDGGGKVSKSSLDRGRKQKRPLRQTAVDAWRG